MIAAVRVSGLGVSSTSIAQHSPAYALPGISGHDTSASGTCPHPTRPPAAARIRRSLRHHARPSRRHRQPPATGGSLTQRGYALAGPAPAGRARSAARSPPAQNGSASTTPGRAKPPRGGVPGAAPPGHDPAQPGLAAHQGTTPAGHRGRRTCPPPAAARPHPARPSAHCPRPHGGRRQAGARRGAAGSVHTARMYACTVARDLARSASIDVRQPNRALRKRMGLSRRRSTQMPPVRLMA